MFEDKGSAGGQKMCDAKIQEILNQLQMKVIETASTSKGGEKPRPFRRSGVPVQVEHPAGGVAKFLAHTAMLWSDGISLLLPGFIYAGSTCTVVLTTQDGESTATRGIVTSSKHTDGLHHATDVRFLNAIDPLDYVDPTGESGNSAEVDMKCLQGRILHLDDSLVDRKLLLHCLRGTSIEVTSVSTGAEAIKAITESAFDIVMCDLNLGAGCDSVQVIGELRERGFAGPLVVVTAESREAKLDPPKHAGATEFLGKPYTQDILIQLMVKLHRQIKAIAPAEMLYSTLSGQGDSNDMVLEYISATLKTARDLKAAVAADDLETVRDLCMGLKGSSAGYGFAALGVFAHETLRLLDEKNSIRAADLKLRTIVQLCSQLAVRRGNAA